MKEDIQEARIICQKDIGGRKCNKTLLNMSETQRNKEINTSLTENAKRGDSGNNLETDRD